MMRMPCHGVADQTCSNIFWYRFLHSVHDDSTVLYSTWKCRESEKVRSFNHQNHHCQHERHHNQHQLHRNNRGGYIAFKTSCDSNMITFIYHWSRQIQCQSIIAYPLQILTANNDDLLTVTIVNTSKHWTSCFKSEILERMTISETFIGTHSLSQSTASARPAIPLAVVPQYAGLGSDGKVRCNVRMVGLRFCNGQPSITMMSWQ